MAVAAGCPPRFTEEFESRTLVPERAASELMEALRANRSPKAFV
jgi:hypothetical protein